MTCGRPTRSDSMQQQFPVLEQNNSGLQTLARPILACVPGQAHVEQGCGQAAQAAPHEVCPRLQAIFGARHSASHYFGMRLCSGTSELQLHSQDTGSSGLTFTQHSEHRSSFGLPTFTQYFSQPWQAPANDLKTLGPRSKCETSVGGNCSPRTKKG